MSKEAKVGLLLGLLFIAGIVLVLRGIHPESSELMNEQLAISEPLGEAPPANAGDRLDFSESVDRLADPWRAPAAVPAPQHAIVGVEPAGVTDPWEESVRYEQELPGPQRAPSGFVAVDPTASVVDVPRRSALEQALDTLASRTSSVMAANVTVEPVAPAGEIASSPVTPTAANAPAARMPVYTVEKGDDLSRIAQRVYGTAEGNRWQNIKRIYEANRDQLTSIDMVRVGQKLRIPPLENGAATRNVATASSRTTAPTAPAAVPGRNYTVKEGESLWSIAAKQLGSGARFKEILDLNRTRLKDENLVQAGVELILPAR